MKKLVRLMSMLLLVAILMSTMAVCAFADEFVIVGGDKPASAEASYDQDEESEEPEEAEAVEDGDEDAEAESEEEEEEPAEEEELAPAPRELPEGYTDFAAMDGIADLYGEIYCAYYNLILNDVDNLTEGDIAAFKMLFGMTPADAVSYGAGAMSADTPDPTISNENADGLFVVNYVYYNSFLDAINAAKKTGYSVYVREPMVFTDTTDSLSIDLQGVTVRFYCNPAIACTRGTLVLYNGTIITDPRTAEAKYHGDDNAAIYASGEDAVIYLNNVTVKTADVEYTDDDKDGTALVASAGPAIIAANGAQVIVNSGSKIYTCDSGGDCAAIEAESGATVTVYGQVKSTFGNAILAEGGNAIIKSGANISSPRDAAIKVNNEGTLTIEGGTIKGPIGIFAESGLINMYGGSVTSTFVASNMSKYINEAGDPDFSDGSAIVLDGDYSPIVTINGGTITAANSKARSISGYIGGVLDSRDVLPKNNVTISNSAKVDNVTRRTYSDQEPVAKIGNMNYASLFDAIYNAKPGETITLLQNIDYVDASVVIDKPITIDGNGYAINISDSFDPSEPVLTVDCGPGNCVTLKNLIVDGDTDSSPAATAKVGIFIDGCVAILDHVEVENCTDSSVSAADADLTVKYLKTDTQTPIGIDMSNSFVCINDCEINNMQAIEYDDEDNLTINNGIFYRFAANNASSVNYALLHDTLGYTLTDYKSRDGRNYYRIKSDVPTITYSSSSCVFSNDESSDYYTTLKWYVSDLDVAGLRFISDDGEVFYIDASLLTKSKETASKKYIVVQADDMAALGLEPGKYVVDGYFDDYGWATCPTPLYVLPANPYISDENANAVSLYAHGSDENLTVVMDAKPDGIGINTNSTINGTIWFDESGYTDDGPLYNEDSVNYLLPSGVLESMPEGQYYIIVKYGEDFAFALPLIIGKDNGVHLYNKGADTHTYAGANSLSFVCTDPIKAVYIGLNKVLLDSKYYTLSADGKTLTLSAEYLNKLPIGSYTLTVSTDRGQTSCGFSVISAATAGATPSTGDTSNILIWSILLVLSAVAIVVLLMPKFRKRKN